VIVNLVINSRDAMPAGGTLTVSTEVAEVRSLAGGEPVMPGRYAVLTVRDTGMGMDAATLARAFEPFFTTKAEGIGTGLGLATVHGIVTQMGGGVAIESEPGRGTVVRIHLPLALMEVEEAAPPPSNGANVIDGATVVVVEDDAESRGLVTRVLEASGCSVVDFACPLEALDWLADDSRIVDVLLSDIVMPGMRGPELARRVLEHRPTLQVLLVSGYSDAELDGAGADVLGGSVGFLAKPFTPRELVARIAELAAPLGAAR
jgi:CheY-like chemotaxis protein